MINLIKTKELRGIIVKNGLSQTDVAKIRIMINKLHIEAPMFIFCHKVTLKVINMIGRCLYI